MCQGQGELSATEKAACRAYSFFVNAKMTVLLKTTVLGGEYRDSIFIVVPCILQQVFLTVLIPEFIRE